MFVMVDFIREMTVKKSCKYGDYGSFEHLLFLFVVTVFDVLLLPLSVMLCVCSHPLPFQHLRVGV